MDMSKIYLAEGELPLDNLVSDGGFVGIFRTVACVGDSLSSGEFEVLKPNGERLYADRFDYSWGQYMARMAGVKVHNFSRGGMTANEYLNSFANQFGYWRGDLAADAYVIALGVNDLLNGKAKEVGTIADVCLEDYTKNADSFVGCFASIIARYRAIAPDSKMFLVTIPRSARHTEEKAAIADRHSEILYELANIFEGVYVIDLRRYAPVYDEEFRRCFFLNGHMAPTGYLLTAKMITSYIDYIIRGNFADFSYVGLSGYDYIKPEDTK